MNCDSQTYNKRQVVSFGKITGRFGGLSNMTSEFALFVNEMYIPNVEVLYQACKFSLFPDIQRQILSERSPMRAKLISRRYQDYVRQDWEQIKYAIMEWCLTLKLMQNWERFGGLLRETGQSEIVEYSNKDAIWGAIPVDDNTLRGCNMLGRLLMKIRERYVLSGNKPLSLAPPAVTGLLLYGTAISDLYPADYYLDDDC